MHIRQVDYSWDDASYNKNEAYPPSDSTYTGGTGGGNGLLNFGIALGGILLITIVTGIIAYFYRKKINCKNISPENSGSGRISCIMDCYSNDYLVSTNNSYIKNRYDINFIDEPIYDKNTSIIIDDKNNKSVRITKGFMTTISSLYNKNNNLKNNRSTSKSGKSTRSYNESTAVDYSIPQISSPVPMPSTSIYDNERAHSLANNLSRSTTLQVTSPPVPPLPTHLPINNKLPKETKRASSGESGESKSKVNSLYNLIPLMFTDSDATTVETVIGPNDRFDIQQQQQYSTSTTAYNNNNNNNNYYYYDYDNNYYDSDYNDNGDYYNVDDNNGDNNGNNHGGSVDLIRFSSKKNSRHNRLYQQKNKSSSTDVINQEIQELQEDKSDKNVNLNKEDFMKELEKNIERDPEKYKFLKNPATNPDNWKRNGNFFEQRLKRGRTVI